MIGQPKNTGRRLGHRSWMGWPVWINTIPSVFRGNVPSSTLLLSTMFSCPAKSSFRSRLSRWLQTVSHPQPASDNALAIRERARVSIKVCIKADRVYRRIIYKRPKSLRSNDCVPRLLHCTIRFIDDTTT